MINFTAQEKECEILLLINEKQLKNSTPETYDFASLRQNQPSSFRLNLNYEYNFKCITNTDVVQMQRITFVDAKNLSHRKILNNELESYFDINGDKLLGWHSNELISKDLNFTDFYIECAYYEPICIRKYKVSIRTKPEEIGYFNNINTQESLQPLYWILGITAAFSVIAIISRLCKSDNKNSNEPNKKSKSNHSSILKKITKRISKKRKQPIIKPSIRLEKVNKNKASFAKPINSDVEIPIIFESKLISQ